MSLDLIKYLSDRYQSVNKLVTNPGPVITISREMGCPGKITAVRLVEALNKERSKLGEREEWKWIGKEILQEASKTLHLGLDQVTKAFNCGERGILDEILSSQATRYYKSDRRVRKTVAEIIRSSANDGHVVIVGRGGVAITRDIPASVHVMLEAPLEWRTIMVSEKCKLSFSEAKKYCAETDKRRTQYRDAFKGKNTDYTWYDIKFNCMSFTIDEIVETIVSITKSRKLL